MKLVQVIFQNHASGQGDVLISYETTVIRLKINQHHELLGMLQSNTFYMRENRKSVEGLSAFSNESVQIKLFFISYFD